MSAQPSDSLWPGRPTLITAILIPLEALMLVVIIREWATVNISAALVTSLSIAVLDWFPIYLDPAGELRLTIVIFIPTLVLFGWQTALLGCAVGIALGILHNPLRDLVVSGTERFASLIVAAAFVTFLSTFNINSETVKVVLVTFGYAAIRTLIISTRMHMEEAISWPRAIRFLTKATFFHFTVFAAVASAAVWIASINPLLTTRLLVPVLAAGITLQLYLPRILRGQEQRRILAAVSVLAAAVDAKDPYTGDHSSEVAQICRRVARILNLDEPEVHRIYLAGLLHDVGKTIVPASILLKPGKLSEEEWEVMRSHVEAGVRIVESIERLAEVAPIVSASHERIDGGGYPRGLKGDDIPLGSRINLVVDAYNALTTDRPYRPARSSREALRELEAHVGTQFDPRVVAALRVALRIQYPKEQQIRLPIWVTLLGRPAFGWLWFGQLVSFLGDEVFFIALTVWVYQLTGSATVLAATLVAATAGQGLGGFLAGALADRIDRRSLMISADISRAMLVAALPFVILRWIPAGWLLLVALNVGTIFFRSALYALTPSVVPRHELATGNALFQTTERIAEIIGGVLGGAVVFWLGFRMAFYLDALSFLVSAACIAMMPVAWRAGLGMQPYKRIVSEIGDGLRYLWGTPVHRFLALLIVPGYLTLAFAALRAPMIIKTAGLPIVAYGVINSTIGVGKLVSAASLTASGERLVSLAFIVAMFLLTALAIALFGLTTSYSVLITAAFFFGLANIATNIANATISMLNTPSAILGRLMASRQVFIAGTQLLGMLIFGRLADLVGPSAALVTLGSVSAVGVLAVWLSAGRKLIVSTTAEFQERAGKKELPSRAASAR